MEVFHLRMGYPSISQYIPIKRLRRCWTIMAIAWIFASEWQTNAQSSEKPTCCDWTSPARDGCAMCWKCFPLCHENASMYEDPTDSPPGCGLVLLKWLLCPKNNQDFQGFIPPKNPLHDRYLSEWYTDDIAPWSSIICPRMSVIEWTWQEPPWHGTGLKECCLWFLSNGLPQQCRSELFVHYGYVCLKCAL